jgi:sodium transport system permease protein
MHAMLTVFRKEMQDHLRDRRSLLVALIYPLMGPLLLGLMFFFVGGTMRGGEAGPLFVPIVNPAGAPDLVEFLERHGARLVVVDDDVRSRVRGGLQSFALVLPDLPPADPRGALTVRLLENPARFDSIVATGRIIEMLHGYERETLGTRLREAGLPASAMDVLDIRQENIGRAAGSGVILLTMITPFLIFTLFTGGVHVALDATSGERERGSFEPLLMNPITRNQVLGGKLGAAIIFTLMALAVQVAAFWVMLRVVPRETLGVVAPPGVVRLATMVSVCVPLVLLACSTQLLVSAVTRSMKEAQTYLGLLPLIPGLAGMVLAFAPLAAGRPLLAAIPTFGQSVLMGQLVRNDAISPMFVGVTVLSTLITTVLLLALALRLYRRDEILFPQ